MHAQLGKRQRLLFSTRKSALFCSMNSTLSCVMTTCPLRKSSHSVKDEKPEDTHVVITGRNAKDELIEIADLVTEMTLIKHPFRSGVKAQEGIEY